MHKHTLYAYIDEFLMLRLKVGQSVDAALSPCITMLKKCCIWQTIFFLFFKIYLLDEHFETIANKIGAFLTVWPLKSQQLDLWPFLQYMRDGTSQVSQTILFWTDITRGICWYGFWVRVRISNFWIWPLYKLSCDPQTSCRPTGCDLADMKYWFLVPYQHNSLAKCYVIILCYQVYTGSRFIHLEPRSNRSRHKTNGALAHSNSHDSSVTQLLLCGIITLLANKITKPFASFQPSKFC